MKCNTFNFSACGRTKPSSVQPGDKAAFTLVEILIAVTLMSVIVLGLMAMFTQTQRAFRLGMNQTDVLESGRIAMDLIVREIEQTAPSGKLAVTTPGLPSVPRTTPGFLVQFMSADNSGRQTLPGNAIRTNWMSDLFFVTRENQTWKGIGYFVRTNAQVAESYGMVGTLYRFETNYPASWHQANTNWLLSGFNLARSGSTNVSKVLEGVIHFSVRAYDENGILIAPPYDLPGEFPNVYEWKTNAFGRAIIRADFPRSFIPSSVNQYFFFEEAVPAFVELEIGILENQTYERYKGILNPQLKQNFYTEHAGNVHLFRQRIPIRRVDLSAYQ